MPWIIAVPLTPNGPSAKGRAVPVVPPYLAAAATSSDAHSLRDNGRNPAPTTPWVRECSSGTSSRTTPDRASTIPRLAGRIRRATASLPRLCPKA